MGRMRSRMEEELRLRGYSRHTVSTYLGAVTRFVRHYQRPPETMGTEQVRGYLVHLTEERGLSWSTINHALCALRFFYVDVLGRPWELKR